MYILDKEHYCWTTDDDCGTPYKTIRDAIEDFYESDCQNLDCPTVAIGHPSYYIPDMFNAEQLYGSTPLPNSKVTQEDYSAGHIVIVKIYSGVFIGEITEIDNEYVTLSSCMKIMGCNMGVAASELDNPEKFPCTSIIKVF